MCRSCWLAPTLPAPCADSQDQSTTSRHMGIPGHTGKRLDRKWKITNQNIEHYQLAGLVAPPEIQRLAFADIKQEVTLREWQNNIGT